MTWEIAFVLLVLAAAVVSFILEKIPPDLTALVVFAVLLGAGLTLPTEDLPGMETILGVFSNHAPLTVACMFIVSAALSKTGAIELITIFFRRFSGLPVRCFFSS